MAYMEDRDWFEGENEELDFSEWFHRLDAVILSIENETIVSYEVKIIRNDKSSWLHSPEIKCPQSLAEFKEMLRRNNGENMWIASEEEVKKYNIVN